MRKHEQNPPTPAICFTPENRLKQKLGESSMADDLRCVAVLESEMDSMSGTLGPVIAQWVAEMQQCLREAYPDVTDCVYARAHDLRGMAGSVGFSELGQLANSLCRYLDDLGPDRQVDMRLLQAHVNAMQLLQLERLPDDHACQTMLAALEFAQKQASGKE